MRCSTTGDPFEGPIGGGVADSLVLLDALQEPALLLIRRASGGYGVVHANPAATRALPANRDEPTGRGLAVGVPADTAAALLALCDGAAGTGRPVQRHASAPDPLTDLGTGPEVTVRVSPLDGLLLCTWLPAPHLDPAPGSRAGGTPVADRLRLADALTTLADTGAGIFTLDLTTGRTVWSAALYAIFDRDPAAGPIGIAEAAARIESGIPLGQRWRALIRDGLPLDIEVKQHRDAGPRRLRIRARAAGWTDGNPAVVHGECRVLD